MRKFSKLSKCSEILNTSYLTNQNHKKASIADSFCKHFVNQRHDDTKVQLRTVTRIQNFRRFS